MHPHLLGDPPRQRLLVSGGGRARGRPDLGPDSKRDRGRRDLRHSRQRRGRRDGGDRRRQRDRSRETADVRTQGAGTASVSLGSSNYATESQGADAITDPGTAFNQTSPPLFANGLVGDFHQLPGSPTVNSGNVIASQLGTADVDGEGRIQGASIDIGADELDEIAPETTITKAPKNRVKTKKRRKRATIRFEADDPAASFACSLDRKPFAPCTSPFTKKVKKGRHRFEVAATDAAGNADQTPDDARWKLKRKRER